MKKSGISYILFLLTSLYCYSQDNMKGSWLSQVQANETSSEEMVNNFLGKLSGNIRPLICNYDNVVLSSAKVARSKKVKHDGSVWECRIDQKAVPDRPDAIDLDIRFKLKRGELRSGGVAIAFDFCKWDAENYVFAPAAVYNGNRHRVMDIGYNAYISEKKDKQIGMPITVANIMHLNKDLSPAKIEMLTGNCSTPVMGFYSRVSGKGVILLTEQETQMGNTGMIIEENATEGKASFVFTAPGVREKRYAGCGFTESGDIAADLRKGDEISMKIRLYVFEAPSLQNFFDRIFTIRKDLSGPTSYRNLAPFSAVADLVLEHHDQHKYYEDEKYGYIANHPELETPFGHLIPGGSVPVWSYPQAIRSNPERLRRVSRSFDALCLAQAESGLFYLFFKKGEIKGGEIMDFPFAFSGIRNNSEVLYFGIQTLELLKVKNHEKMIKPEWNEMLRKNADAFVRIWNKYGQFGYIMNAETGEMDTPGSTAGAEAIAGLALASGYFNNPEYMRVAEEAGEYYYRRDLSKGYTGGGPGDILQAQDAESNNYIADSYTILYEMTGKEKWLKYAREAAAMLSTWVMSYDYRFPETSDMYKFGNTTTGSVWASTQNAHSAPGLYVMPGTFLLKLYRATGDKRYIELLRDIAHNVVQYANTPTNNIIPLSPYGSATERVNTSDWEGKKMIGDILDKDSNMAWETVILFSILQNPGIYFNTSTGDMFVLDNVEAEVVSRTGGQTILKITNTTFYNASVTLLSENDSQRKIPLDMYAFTNYRRVEIPANETRIIEVKH